MKTLLNPFALSLLVGSVVFGSQTAKAELTVLFASHDVIRFVSGELDSSEWRDFDWDTIDWEQRYQTTFESESDDHWAAYSRESISMTDYVLGWYGTSQSRGWTDTAEFLFKELNEGNVYDTNAIRVTFTLIQYGGWSENEDVFLVTDNKGNELLNYSGLNNQESYSAQDFELIFQVSGNELSLFFQAFLENNNDGKKHWGINDFTIYQTPMVREVFITPAPASAVMLGIGMLTLCGAVFQRKKRIFSNSNRARNAQNRLLR